MRFANLPPSVLSPVFACVGFDDQGWGETPLPFDATALDGSVFFVQGVVLANGANPGGALLSDSGRGVIGSL